MYPFQVSIVIARYMSCCYLASLCGTECTCCLIYFIHVFHLVRLVCVRQLD